MIRLILGLPIAFVITIGLFLLMRYLILVEYQEQDAIESATINITRPERDESLNTRDRNKPDRPEQADTPPPPPMQVPQANPNNMSGVSADFSGLQKEIDLGKIAAAVDTNAIPILCQPNLTAQQVGSGGWIVISFDITANGSVENPEVVEGSPPGKYDRIMLREVRKCKFKAKTQEGKPVPQFNKQYMFTLKPPQ